jgi:hypothetical protein
LYAYPSLLENIGFDGSETHKQDPALTGTFVTDRSIVMEDIPLMETQEARKLYCRHLYRQLGVKAKIKRWLTGGIPG